MENLHECHSRSKCPFSERFATVLSHFLTVLEGEWRQRNPFMTSEEQVFFRWAHRSLAGLLDMEEAER